MPRHYVLSQVILKPVIGTAALAVCLLSLGRVASGEELANACPVDGCTVKIVKVEKSGTELAVVFEANFKPDMSKNHIHIWWGENYSVEQVSGNAETVYKVKQGEWHPTDAYPNYVTQSAASVSVRGNAKSLCVSPADRNHDILDAKIVMCLDVSDYL